MIIDFTDGDRLLGRGYHGNAGMKRAYLHDGIVWMVKFPKSTRELEGRHLPSHTSSPISEYVGSHVYGSIGIPAHETVLGRCEGKIVVGCRDFTVDADLLDFHCIKNTVDEDSLSGSIGSSTHGERLRDVLYVIDTAADFEEIRDEVRSRFWDMFVVDALIHNNDRNNGNWGLLVSRYITTLAPVFDNGNSFFNKRNPSVTERRLADSRSLEDDVDNTLSFFLDDEDRHIKPLKYIESLCCPDCTSALVRVAGRLDMSRIREVIEEIPEEAFGLKVISPETKRLYVGIVETVIERCFNPTLERIGKPTIDPYRGEDGKPDAVTVASEARRARASSAALDAPLRGHQGADTWGDER